MAGGCRPQRSAQQQAQRLRCTLVARAHCSTMAMCAGPSLSHSGAQTASGPPPDTPPRPQPGGGRCHRSCAQTRAVAFADVGQHAQHMVCAQRHRHVRGSRVRAVPQCQRGGAQADFTTSPTRKGSTPSCQPLAAPIIAPSHAPPSNRIKVVHNSMAPKARSGWAPSQPRAASQPISTAPSGNASKQPAVGPKNGASPLAARQHGHAERRLQQPGQHGQTAQAPAVQRAHHQHRKGLQRHRYRLHGNADIGTTRSAPPCRPEPGPAGAPHWNGGMRGGDGTGKILRHGFL